MISKAHSNPNYVTRYLTLGEEPRMIVAVAVQVGTFPDRSSTDRVVDYLKDLPRVDSLRSRAWSTDHSEFLEFLKWISAATEVYLWTGRRWQPVKSGNAAYLAITHSFDCAQSETERSRSKRAWRTFLRTVQSVRMVPSAPCSAYFGTGEHESAER